MQHQAGLLLLAFGRHKTHRRTCHCLADRRSIIGVILTALEIGLHVTGRHQPHPMADRPKLSAPMMGTWAGFNADKARRQSREELQHLGTAHTLADHNRSIGIHAVHLKYRLRNIETNRANFAHGRLPSMCFALTQPPYGTSMPQSGRRPQHHSRPTLRASPAVPCPRYLPKASHLLRDDEMTRIGWTGRAPAPNGSQSACGLVRSRSTAMPRMSTVRAVTTIGIDMGKNTLHMVGL